MSLVSQHLFSPARLFVIRYRAGVSAVLNSPCGLLGPLLTSSSQAGGIELWHVSGWTARFGGCTHTDEIAALEVETVQFVTGLLCIHDIFKDDERRALGVVGNSLADLAGACSQYQSVLSYVGENAYRIGPNLPKRSNSSSGVTL